MIQQQNIRTILEALDRELAAHSSGAGVSDVLVICGGAALISLGIRSTSTMDIDVITPDLSQELIAVAAVVGKQFGLARDWFNNGPKSLVPLLPADWQRRLTPIFRGKRLSVDSLGRPELLLSKIFAEADRQEDLEDIMGLRPTRAELDAAATLVVTFDANPDWPAHVARTVERIWARLKQPPSS